MNVSTVNQHVRDSAGNQLVSKSALRYLGVSLASDGKLESEVTLTLGTASLEFKALARIWSHTRVSKAFRHTVYTASVVQKLLYGLEGAWLNKALLTKLDGFHAKCLRKLLGIPPSFLSRVSNAFVLQE